MTLRKLEYKVNTKSKKNEHTINIFKGKSQKRKTKKQTNEDHHIRK